MTDIKTDIGVQSYCFRHFTDNPTVAKLVREIGVDKIELCGVHANFNDPATFDDVIGIYRDAGIEIVAIGVQGFSGDEQKERPWFEFAKRAGAKAISADFSLPKVPDAYTVADKLAREYGVRIAIHNHGGPHWLGSSAMLGHVFSTTPESIGLCLDTAWALDARENPVKMAERFSERLYGLHIKDFIFDRARQPEDVIVGTGNLDLPTLASVLQSRRFDGYAVLEYEGDVENPVPALTKCVDAVRAL